MKSPPAPDKENAIQAKLNITETKATAQLAAFVKNTTRPPTPGSSIDANIIDQHLLAEKCRVIGFPGHLPPTAHSE